MHRSVGGRLSFHKVCESKLRERLMKAGAWMSQFLFIRTLKYFPVIFPSVEGQHWRRGHYYHARKRGQQSCWGPRFESFLCSLQHLGLLVFEASSQCSVWYSCLVICYIFWVFIVTWIKQSPCLNYCKGFSFFLMGNF
jgi:hypothetical protein